LVFKWGILKTFQDPAIFLDLIGDWRNAAERIGATAADTPQDRPGRTHPQHRHHGMQLKQKEFGY
jgi:hypothetical protein